MEEGGKTVNGRAEIDTRPPFRSVKDAVSLYGQGILCGDVDSRKLKERNPGGGSELESMTMELEDTKQRLEKAREETELMATQMSSLKQELENTKRELRQLKELRESKMVVAVDLGETSEELKFVKDSPKPEEDESDDEEEEEEDDDDQEEEETEFRNKRYVTFEHPTLSQIILPEQNPSPALLERNPPIKKKKAFTLLPSFGGIFPKRKTKCDV